MTQPHPSSSERPPGTAPFLPAGWWNLPVRRRRSIGAAVVGGVALVLMVLLLVGGGGSTTGTGAGTDENDDDASMFEAFVEALPEDRLATWERLAQCETGGDWQAATGNGFFGGLQFTPESWETVGGTGSPADASRDEQIFRAESLFDLQGWDAWPSCARQLDLI